MECRLDRIPSGAAPQEAAPIDRSPDNELFDRGCDLVAAAAAIRRVAGAPDAARAAPAVLGCIEAALHDLAEATAALDTSAASRQSDARSERLRRGYANLREALGDARRAAAAARPLAGRVL